MSLGVAPGLVNSNISLFSSDRISWVPGIALVDHFKPYDKLEMRKEFNLPLEGKICTFGKREKKNFKDID